MKRIPEMAFAAAILCTAVLQSNVAQASQVQVMISDKAVEKVAAAAFPVTITGKKVIGVGFLKQEVNYTATVGSPRVTIQRDGGEFTAFADVSLDGGVKLKKVRVRGRLDIYYDKSSEAIIVDVAEAVMDLRTAGGVLNFSVDVSEDIPMFPLSVSVPQLSVPVGEKHVVVKPIPTLSLQDGHILVDVDLDVEEIAQAAR